MGKEAARMIAALIKSAANEDLAGSLSKLETLRQNAALRHDVHNDGMLAGGRAAGTTAGQGLGAAGGLAGIVALLRKSKMGMGAKLGLGAASTVGSGLGLGMAGGSAGQSLAKLNLPKLPPEMQAPATMSSAPAISKYLSKQAVDMLRAAALRPDLPSRLEKSAGGFGDIAKGIGGYLGAGMKRLGSNTVARPFTARAPGASPLMGARQFSPGRTATMMGGAGVVGGGGIAGGHMYNNAQNTTERSLMNPFTWGSRPSEEDIFKRNQLGYDEARQGMQGEMDSAIGSQDHEKFKQLNERFQKGDFAADTGMNPLNWRMGGLNPFAKDTGAGYQQRMIEQQKGLQGKYNAEMGKVGPQAGDEAMQKYLEERLQSPDLLPAQAQAMQKQLEAMKTRMAQAPGTQTDAAAAAIRQRMEAAGMRFNPFKAQGAPAPTTKPTGAWNLGGRPRMPGYMTGASMMPGDFRPYQQPWDYVQNSNTSPFHNG